MNYTIHTPSATRFKQEITKCVSEKIDANGNGIATWQCVETDDDIRQYLRGHWQLEHPTDLQKKEKTVRNEILIEAIQYGAPLRQLSRLTGISYGVIQRINGKMKLGQ